MYFSVKARNIGIRVRLYFKCIRLASGDLQSRRLVETITSTNHLNLFFCCLAGWKQNDAGCAQSLIIFCSNLLRYQEHYCVPPLQSIPEQWNPSFFHFRNKWSLITPSCNNVLRSLRQWWVISIRHKRCIIRQRWEQNLIITTNEELLSKFDGCHGNSGIQLSRHGFRNYHLGQWQVPHQ